MTSGAFFRLTWAEESRLPNIILAKRVEASPDYGSLVPQYRRLNADTSSSLTCGFISSK